MRHLLVVLSLLVLSALPLEAQSVGTPLAPFETALTHSEFDDALSGGAFNGEQWLITRVSMFHPYQSTHALYGHFVSPDGRSSTPGFLISDQAGSSEVVWNGEHFIVAYARTISRFNQWTYPNIEIRTVTADGTVSDPLIVDSSAHNYAGIISIEPFGDQWLLSYQNEPDSFELVWLDHEGNPATEPVTLESPSMPVLVSHEGRLVWIAKHGDELVARALDGDMVHEIAQFDVDITSSVRAVESESGIWATVSFEGTTTLLRLTDQWIVMEQFPITRNPLDLVVEDGEIWIVHEAPESFDAIVYDISSGSHRTVNLVVNAENEDLLDLDILQSNGQSILVARMYGGPGAEPAAASDLYAAPFPTLAIDAGDLSLISTSAVGGQQNPVAAADGVDLVVAWQQYSPEDDTWDTVIRSFGPDMLPKTDPIVFPHGISSSDLACVGGRCLLAGRQLHGDTIWTIVDLDHETVQEARIVESFVDVRTGAASSSFLLVGRTAASELEVLYIDRNGNASAPFPFLPNGAAKTDFDLASCEGRYELTWIQPWTETHDNVILGELSESGVPRSVELIGDRQSGFRSPMIACNGDDVLVAWSRRHSADVLYNGIFDGELLDDGPERGIEAVSHLRNVMSKGDGFVMVLGQAAYWLDRHRPADPPAPLTVGLPSGLTASTADTLWLISSNPDQPLGLFLRPLLQRLRPTRSR